MQGGEEIRIAHGLHYWCLQPDVLWDQAFHTSICPLHTAIGGDCDDRILHGVQKGFQLALALLNGGETVFQATRSFIESGCDLPDFVIGL